MCVRRINASSTDSEGNDSRLASRIVLEIEPEALIRRLRSYPGLTVSLTLLESRRSWCWGVCKPIAMLIAPLTNCGGS